VISRFLKQKVLARTERLEERDRHARGLIPACQGGLTLAPFTRHGAPAFIEADGTIDRGAKNCG